jgi:GrpB-like predicted nucleotidyltransferase (UPF0157 family)
VTDEELLEILEREPITLVPHDPLWPQRFNEVEALLRRSLPADLWTRIAHIGSTAVPGLSGKPIVDVQVEVRSLDRVRQEVVPFLTELGYEHVWRPTMGEHAPFYAWFIARNAKGERTVHIHMVEPDAASEDRILFRDFLRKRSDAMQRYARLKSDLLEAHPKDRAAFTRGKTAFIASILQQARQQRP